MTWTAEQEAELRTMYGEGVPASAIAKMLGKSKSAVYSKAERMGIADVQNKQQMAASRTLDHLYQSAYRSGYRRREKGRTKSPPAKYEPAMRAWWLAGFHDADMELGVSVLEGAA